MRKPIRRAGGTPRGPWLGATLVATGLTLLPLTTGRTGPGAATAQTAAAGTGTALAAAGIASLNQALLAEEASLQFFNLNAGKSFLTAAPAAGAAAAADLAALNGMAAEIHAGHQAHVTMLQQLLGANAQPIPAFQNLDAASLSQFLTMAQNMEDIDVNVHQGVLLTGLQSGSLNPVGSAATPPAASAPGAGSAGGELAVLADDARYDGGLRAFTKTTSTGAGGNPNTLLTPSGTPLGPGFTAAQATAALQSFIASSTPGATSAPPAVTVSFSKDILRIFTNNGAKTCGQAGCHGGPSPQLGQNLMAANAYASIVNVPSVEKPSLLRVKPGDAAHSYLYQKITGAPGISGSRMPLGAGSLAASDIALIQQWINAGAPNN
jgi:hypothetical protein